MEKYGKNIVVYTIQKKYKGRIINIKVRDGYINGIRSTVITCDYDTGIICFSNGSNEKVQHFIDRKYVFAKKKIDEESIGNKIKKLFR